MQDVKNTEISVLVCCVFEGSIIIGCGCDFTKVELHAKLGCEFASPLEANVFFFRSHRMYVSEWESNIRCSMLNSRF